MLDSFSPFFQVRLIPSHLSFQVRLSFLTAPSFALLDHPLPLVLRLENNCERTVGFSVFQVAAYTLEPNTCTCLVQVELDLSLSSPTCGLLTWYGKYLNDQIIIARDHSTFNSSKVL